MANSPTIVSASLDDKEMRQSIANLVAYVKRATQTMSGDLDAAVEKMNASLKKLGTPSSGGSANTSATKQDTQATEDNTTAKKKNVQATKEQAQANKENKLTLDQMAQAQQQAVAPKSARDSFYAFVQGYKQQAQELSQYIKSFETGLNQAISSRLNELNSQLSTSKLKAKELNDEMNRQYASGNKQGAAHIQEQLDRELRTHNQIESAIKNVNKEFAFEISYLASLYGELNNIHNKWHDVNTTNKSLTESQKQQTAELAQQSKIVGEIKSKQDASKAFERISLMPTENIDQAKEKLAALEELKKRVANTPLFSAAKNNQLSQAIETTSYKIASLEAKAKSDAHIVSDSVKSMNAAIEANRKASVNAEEEKRQQIVQTGLTAQQTAKTIGEAMSKQLSNGEQITQVKELENAWRQMQQALNNMTQEQLKSPVGQMLAETTAKTELALTAVRKYNEELSRTNTQQTPRTPSSYNELNEILKQLTDTYKNLSREERNAAKGTQLADKIQRIGRETQKAQQQMNRPINLDAALKGSEKTLDDIAYKMQRLSAYKRGIDLTKEGAAKEIEEVDRRLQQLQKDADKWMSKSKSIIEQNNALGRSWNYMKNRLAFYFTVGASTSFVKNLIEIRSQYEMNERALGILIDSAERGTRIFNELSQMALVSPYTLIELSTAAKQLTAYDIAAKDVVDTTRRLADMAAAVGIPIERLTYALGQIKAYGYLNARDARMFSNAGIPLVKQLSDYYSQLEGRIVSVGDVYDRIKKKAIGMNEVLAVINKMTDEGGKFFDFQAKMAGTLKVQLANLTLAWNNMLNDIGSSEQGVITAGISGLKELFLKWKDIETAITKIVYAFGLYKTAQMISLIWTGRITTAMGVQELVGKKLQARLAGLTAANSSFVSGATAGYAALALIVTDILMTVSKNADEIERLNKTIEDNANEAAEALDKLLHSSEMVSARLSASSNKLSTSEAEKTWERLREQIELSAASNKLLIDQLLLETDLNKRVSEAFTLAESIEKATQKLSDLNGALDVSQNSILMGLFGEGLIEDIEDYNAHLKRTGEIADWTKNKTNDFWKNSAIAFKGLFEGVKETLGSSEDEAIEEIKNFAKNSANVIREELGEEGLRDKVQVNEAVARIVSGIEQMYPQIRGKGKVLFETLFYDTMSKEFSGSVDKMSYYYDKFLSQLKKDHASAFGDVTEEILDDTHKWSSAQIDVIKKTAEKIKKDMPEASQKAIDDILAQLNSTQFKVRIVAELSTTSIDDVNKEFKKKFITNDAQGNVLGEKQQNENMQKYGTLLRKNGEDNVKYEKRISEERKNQLEISQKNADIIEKNKNKTDALSKSITKDAEKEKEAADAWLAAANDVAKAGGYDFSTKKENADARKNQKQAESELQKALKEELQLIDKVRSSYKTLTKEGVGHVEAIEQATSGFSESVSNINKVLGKYGIGQLDLTKYAGVTNPTEIVNMLESQVNKLLKSGVAKPAEIQDLQVKIRDLKVDAASFNAKTVTDSLNNALGKLKDEYELAVELDANPELGDMFLDMFGIDKSALSSSMSNYMSAVQAEFDKARQKMGYESPLNVFKADSDEWVEWGRKVGIVKDTLDEQGNVIASDTEALDKFKSKFVEAQGVAKKWAQDTVKQTLDLQYELSDADGKIAIELKKLNRLQEQFINATDPQQIELLSLQIQKEEHAIAKLKEEIMQTLPLYKALFAGEFEMSANKTNRLAKQYRDALLLAKSGGLGSDGNYTYTDPISGKKASINKNQMEKELKNANKLIKQTSSPFKQISDAFKKGSDGTTDWAKGVELLGGELIKVGGIVSSIGDFAEQLGFSRETVEIINDVASSINGVATMAQGLGQFASGDYIGGAASMLSGLMTTVGTWLDNSDNKILDQIKESERAVKKLENAMLDLEDAANHAYGAIASGAQRGVIANKELQLAELKRQIQLEKSRDSKHRDEDRIVELEGQYKQLLLEIKNGIEDVVNEMLGISSAGDAVTQLVESMIDAFRNGEDAMQAFSDKWDEMIDNMILKLIVSQYMQQAWEKVLQTLKDKEEEMLAKSSESKSNIQSAIDQFNNMSDKEKALFFGIGKWSADAGIYFNENQLQQLSSKYLEGLINQLNTANESGEKASEDYLKWSLDYMMGEGRSLMEGAAKNLLEGLGDWYTFGQDKDSALSALQQGIQGITEDTAGAIEAYLNGISQQIYLHSTLLTEIRDAIAGISGGDLQLGVQSQMLLQLQDSYTVQKSIESILAGVLNPSGRAFAVELIS